MLKKLALFAVFIAVQIVSFAQTNQSYGVSIAEDSLPPHPSAILDVRSVNKGVLIPRMTFNEMLSLGGNTPPMGTTVYVEVDKNADWQQQQKRGLYYWNSDRTLDPDLQKWVKLEIKRVQYPVGAILFYSLLPGEDCSLLFDESGKGEGKMDGWAICNGNNGTPDLRGRFVVGGDAEAEYDDYAKLGNKSGYSILHSDGGTSGPLSENNLMKHTHQVDFNYRNNISVQHTHIFKDRPHTHTDRATKKNAENNRGFDHVLFRDSKYWKPFKTKKSEKDIKEGHSAFFGAKVKFKIDEAVIPVDVAKIGDAVQPTGGGGSIDNRPPFYVALYIMRISGNSSIDEGNNVAVPKKSAQK